MPRHPNYNEERMNKYRISYITTIYGVEPYIAKFAETFLGQTYNDIQFIFVNDGTKDASMEILNSIIEERFSHLKERIVIINKPNEGLPLARKSGLEVAEGEYVLFADADDWIELNAIERVMDVADRTNADIIYFDLVKEYGHKRSIKRELEYTAATRELWIENIFNYRSHGYTATKCFRRSLYTDNHIFTPKLGMHEDMYLMAQLIYRAKSIVRLPEVLYHYRKDNEISLTRRYKAKLFSQWSELYSRIRKYLDENSLGEDFYKALDNRICLSMIGLGLNELCNKEPHSKRMKNLKAILSSEQYKKAFSNLEFGYFPIHWKLFFTFCKRRNVLFVYVLLNAMQMMIGK